MALVDTSFVNPGAYQLVPDATNISNQLGQLLGQRRKEKQMRQQAQKIEKAQQVKSAFKMAGAQMLRVRDMEYTSQRKELAELGQAAIQRGENPSVFTEGLNITNPDELNLYLTRVATQAGDAEKMLDQRLRAEKVSVVNKKAFQPVTLVNPDTKEKMLVSPVVDPATGKATLSEFEVPAGFEISRETPEEKRAADVIAAGEKKKAAVAGGAEAERINKAITAGQDAADGYANIKRGLELIDLVETGGLDAAALKAKQLFGIEGANEAELSSRLGKAVLSQLRATFGAAFTEREGARLAAIEAGFGKSTEGNRRLLNQTKRIIERVANRGIKSAEKAGDEVAAQDIRDALSFSLSIDEKQPVKSPSVSNTVDFSELP